MQRPMTDAQWAKQAVRELIARCARQAISKWRADAGELARRSQ